MPIRVLVAEDSPTARALLVGMLTSTGVLEVVGQATNGLEVLELTRRLRPDVITMDIQMPGLDGFAATQRIMAENPTPIVIVSSLDVTTVQFSMDALRAGALAVLPKPVGPTSPDYDAACRSMIATVRSMSQVKLVRRWGDQPPYRSAVPPRPTRARPSEGAARVVAIAASTGGPAALRTVLAELPANFAAPILFVQHIALGFADGFARWLNEHTKIEVRVAQAGEPLRGGTAYLAPDNAHLGVSERSTVTLSTTPAISGFRPSGTFLFESVGRIYGPAALGVILTGMGSDGVEGLRTLRAQGGRVFAQDEASSAVFGMPGAAVSANLVDQVLGLDAMAAAIRRAVERS